MTPFVKYLHYSWTFKCQDQPLEGVKCISFHFFSFFLRSFNLNSSISNGKGNCGNSQKGRRICKSRKHTDFLRPSNLERVFRSCSKCMYVCVYICVGGAELVDIVAVSVSVCHVCLLFYAVALRYVGAAVWIILLLSNHPEKVMNQWVLLCRQGVDIYKQNHVGWTNLL